MASMAPLVRRLPAAVLVAVATAIAFTSLVGVQADDGASSEESLALGYPAVGDRWTYQIVVEGPWRFGPADDMRAGTPYPYAEMEWLDPVVVRDSEGAEVAADRLHVKRLGYNGDEDYAENHDGHHWVPDEARHLFHAGRAESLGTESPVTSDGRGGDGGSGLVVVGNEPLVETSGVTVVEGWARWYGQAHAPCLARSPLQGTTISLDEPILLFADCLPRFDENADDEEDDGFWSYGPMVGQGPFEYAATERLLGQRAQRFDADDGTSIWLTDGLPVPLQAKSRNGDQVATVTLSSYEAGGSPLGASSPAPKPGLAPAVVLAPRQPWGPSDSGVDHPFAASVAFQQALEDPGFSYLRDWLADHRDGATFMLEYSEDLTSMPQTRSWFFGLTAHDSVAAFQSTQSSYGPLAVPPTVTHREMGQMGMFLSWFAPDVEALPAELPTAASVTARWQAYEVTEGRSPEANGWGLGMWCVLDCSYGLYGEVVAGKDPVAFMHIPGASLGPSVGIPQLQNRTFTGSQLEADVLDGRTKSLTQWTGYDEGLQINSLDGQTPVDPTTEPAPGDAGPRRALATLVPTPEQGAAITLASALAGLLYWLWPSLKSGSFLGLFSRLQGPQLLAHPTRARLHQLIQAEPGIHFQDLVRRSALANGTAVHHLHKLAQAGLVSARPLGRYTCYFPGQSIDRASLAAAPVTRSDGARRILAELAAHPGLSGHEVAVRLGLQHSTVSYHVKRLQDVGLVAAQRDGRVVRFRTVARA